MNNKFSRNHIILAIILLGLQLLFALVPNVNVLSQGNDIMIIALASFSLYIIISIYELENELKLVNTLFEIEGGSTHKYLREKAKYFANVIDTLQKGGQKFYFQKKYATSEILEFVKCAENSLWGISFGPENYLNWWGDDVTYDKWISENVKLANRGKEVTRLFIISIEDLIDDVKFNILLQRMKYQSDNRIKVFWASKEILKLLNIEIVDCTLLDIYENPLLLQNESHYGLNEVSITWGQDECERKKVLFNELFRFSIPFDSAKMNLTYFNKIADDIKILKNSEEASMLFVKLRQN